MVLLAHLITTVVMRALVELQSVSQVEPSPGLYPSAASHYLSLFVPILHNTNTRIPMDITSLLTIPVKQPL